MVGSGAHMASLMNPATKASSEFQLGGSGKPTTTATKHKAHGIRHEVLCKSDGGIITDRDYVISPRFVKTPSFSKLPVQVAENPNEELLASEEILSIICHTHFGGGADTTRSQFPSRPGSNNANAPIASASPVLAFHATAAAAAPSSSSSSLLVPPLMSTTATASYTSVTTASSSMMVSAFAAAMFHEFDSMRIDSPLSFLLPCSSPPMSPHPEDFDEIDPPPSRAHNPLPLNTPFEHDESQSAALEFLAFAHSPHSSVSSPFLKFSPLAGKRHRMRSRSMGDCPATQHPAYAQRRAEDNHHLPFFSSQLAAHVS